jgi:apolipoprotein N-acyltransferase
MMGAIALGIAFHWAPGALRMSTGVGVNVSRILFVVLGLWEALPLGLIAGLASWQLRKGIDRLWIIPTTWVALEAFWPKVLPWKIAYSQTDFLPFLQSAELVGSAGISFIFMFIAVLPAGLVHVMLHQRTKRANLVFSGYGISAVTLLIASLVFGYHRLERWQEVFPSHHAVNTAIIQVDPRFTDSIEKMRRKTLAMEEDLDLVLWPECTLGTYSFELEHFQDPDQTMILSAPPKVDLQPAAGLACELLAGGKSYHSDADPLEGPFVQTAFLVNPDQTIQSRYMKRSLMPIGEYVPGQQFFPKLRKLADIDEIGMTGKNAKPLESRRGMKVGVLMCYEDMVPRHVRQTVAQGAEVIVTLANGTAFENPLALEQHMRLALMRAVENRRYFARCTASGVSCVVSPTGNILERADVNKETAITAEIPLLTGRTFYNRFGYLLLPSLLLVTLFLLGYELQQWWQSRRKKNGEACAEW